MANENKSEKKARKAADPDKPSPVVSVFKRETLIRVTGSNPETGEAITENVDALVKIGENIPGREVYGWIRNNGAEGNVYETGRMKTVSLANVVVKARLMINGKVRNSNPGPRKPKDGDAKAAPAKPAASSPASKASVGNKAK